MNYGLRPADSGTGHKARQAHAMTAMRQLPIVLGVLGALAGPAAAAPAGPPVSIIGGAETTAADFPAVVALTIGNNLCTGTLITPLWVLTAAHCVDPDVIGLASQDQVTSSAQVHFHTLSVLEDPGTVVRAAATFKDPLFNKAHLGNNDIGLIKLAKAVTDVVPAGINLDAAMAPVGTVVTIVGYGSTQQSGQGSVGVQFALSNRTSVSCPSLSIGADTNLLCFSQADNKGTCSGDSGGPSFAVIGGKALVVGVTSFGDQDCAQFGAETRVDVEQAFLVAHIPELIGCVSDSDCSGQRLCFAHSCIADPFSPTGVGTLCNTAADCESAQCTETSQDGKRCSFTCSVSNAASCPNGFDCLQSSGDVGACWPAEGGGCCDTSGAGGPTAMLLGLGVAVMARRRKRA